MENDDKGVCCYKGRKLSMHHDDNFIKHSGLFSDCSLRLQDVEKVREKFMAYDDDGSGTVDTKELGMILAGIFLCLCVCLGIYVCMNVCVCVCCRACL